MEIIYNGKKIDRIHKLVLGGGKTDTDKYESFVIYDGYDENGVWRENQVLFFNVWDKELEDIIFCKSKK